MDHYYKKSGSIFNAHSYWTKQPVDVITKFIKANSAEGDIVLDPFCGSGMTGVACILSNRRYLLSDISPICLHIAKGYCQRMPQTDVDGLISDLTANILDYYTVDCPECGKVCQIDYAILEDKLEKEKRLDTLKIVFHCPRCKKKISKVPDSNDSAKQNTQNFKDLYYPKDHFFGNEPKRNYKRGVLQVYQLYSNRNLTALATLLDNIKKLPEPAIRQLCLFAFTSILFNCSIMSRYNPKYENTQIKMGTYYIPQYIKDNNVVSSFTRKLRSIIRSNDEIFSNGYDPCGDIVFADATDLAHIADDSIDYIYTDPPYSDKISYSELNLVYESWLGNGLTDTTGEMIVSKNGNKGIKEYSSMFSAFLREAYRVLKPGKRLTIIFHNSNLEHWAYFQEALASSSFVPVVTDVPERILSRSKTSTQYQAANNSQCFLAFTLEKSPAAAKNAPIELPDDKYKAVIDKLRQDAVRLGFKSKSDQYDFVINGLLFKYKIKSNILI